MRRLSFGMVLAVLLVALPAAAQEVGNGCASRFPDTAWGDALSSGSITVWPAAGIHPDLARRYAADFGALAALLEEELGPVPGITVCAFPGRIPWDAVELGWDEGKTLHTATFAAERVVVISAYLTNPSIDAGRNGILHTWLFNLTGGTYPEPLADEVKGWYRNRLERSVESVHLLFVRQNIGLVEPWPPFPWTIGRMVDPLLWNPEFSYGGAGDFANFVAATVGTGPLAAPRTDEIQALDAQWRQALFDESGSVLGGSKEWIVGLVGVIGIILLAVLMAYWTRRERRRIERELREAVQRERREVRDEGPVRPSNSAGRRGGDARVGRAAARTAVVDRNDGDRSPSGGKIGSRSDDVTAGAQSADDLFRHPDLRGDD